MYRLKDLLSFAIDLQNALRSLEFRIANASYLLRVSVCFSVRIEVSIPRLALLEPSWRVSCPTAGGGLGSGGPVALMSPVGSSQSAALRRLSDDKSKLDKIRQDEDLAKVS